MTIVWGASFPLMKIVLEYIPAFAFLSIRFMAAAIILSVVYYKSFKKLNKRALGYGVILGLFMFGGMGIQVVGLYTTSASNSGFITGLSVVMVPIVSAMMLKKKPDRSSFVGVALAFAGLFFMSGGLNPNFNIGDFLTFLCAICWTFQIIFVDKYTRIEDASLLAIFQLLFTGLAGSSLWLAVDFGKPVVINGTVILIILITSVFGSSLAYAVQASAQKHTTPTHASLIFTAEPVFAVIFAMIIPNAEGLTEIPTITEAVGCLLILAGTIISEFRLGQKSNIPG